MDQYERKKQVHKNARENTAKGSIVFLFHASQTKRVFFRVGKKSLLLSMHSANDPDTPSSATATQQYPPNHFADRRLLAVPAVCWPQKQRVTLQKQTNVET